MNDLISREALKTIESIQSADFNSIETIREWIDNAPSVPAIPIPEGATNGDVIKAIFSDNVFAEERWQDENGKMCTDVISDNGMTFTDIWWNSPYKRGDTE